MDDETIEILNVCRLKEFLTFEITAAHAHLKMATIFKDKLTAAGYEDVESLVNEIEGNLHG